MKLSSKDVERRNASGNLLYRNWPGLLSIALVVASVAAYLPATGLFAMGTVASLVVGIAAVVRARRGLGSVVLASVGVVVGGVLTVLWVWWIVAITLNPGGIG